MTGASVLLVSDGDFTASYVATTLAERGFRVVHSSELGLATMMETATDGIAAVVIISRWPGPSVQEQLARLRTRHIPALLLLSPGAARRVGVATDVPLLTEPYAAYQVADWVAEAAASHAPAADVTPVVAVMPPAA